MRNHHVFISSLCLFFIIISFHIDSPASLVDRDSDPVVLNGSSLPVLLGAAPGRIVAFRHESMWIQVPVQVDERAIVDFGSVYGDTTVGITTLVYTDTSTFVGADSDTSFDSDDELVFMAKDAGEKVPAGTPDPEHVIPFSRVEIEITDPLNYNKGYIYLFQSDGTIDPGASSDYVTYNFNLLSGNYKQTYNTESGPNPEDSEVSTPFYRVHFSDRWIRDEIMVYVDSATGEDILDRHKSLFAPGNCGRSEDTFSAGEGAFFANIDGPVRAIRSYLGANSGPFTQRVHIFYEKRHDIRTYLRVHSISGIMDYYDYSPSASGMSYMNDLNTTGVIIDGYQDTVTNGPITWEMVTGTQGTLVMSHTLETDIPGFAYTSYYSDDISPSVTQCTGDAYEYGASGPWVDQSIPNTDPTFSPYNHFESSRLVYFEGPNKNVTLAEKRDGQARNPLSVSATPTGISALSASRSLRLYQNIPNPFSTRTWIRFECPQGLEVNLQVYDVLGRLVRTLFSGTTQAKSRIIEWDRRDRYGNPVSTGIYFYRLKAGKYSFTRKMVILN